MQLSLRALPPPLSVSANRDAYRKLVGKDLQERLMDREVANALRENEGEVRAKTAEKAEVDRRYATQKANLATESAKIKEKQKEVSGAFALRVFPGPPLNWRLTVVLPLRSLADWKAEVKELLASHGVASLDAAVTKLQDEISNRRE